MYGLVPTRQSRSLYAPDQFKAMESRQRGGDLAAKLNLNSVAGWEKVLNDGDGSARTKKLSIREAYHVIAFFRRAIKLRGNALQAIPYTISDKEGNIVWDSDTPSTDLPDVLATAVNAFMTQSLLFKMETAYALEGVVYILKEFDSSVNPSKLRWLEPQLCKPKVDEDGGFVGVAYKTKSAAGSMHTDHFKVEDLIYFFEPDPYFSDVPGAPGDARSGRVHADVIDSLETWADRHFDRGLVRQVVAYVKGALPEGKVLADLKRNITNTLFGKHNAGEVNIFSKDQIEFEPIGEGLREFQQNTFQESEWKQIATACGVPYSLLTSGASNYAEKESDMLSLYVHTLFADASLIQNALNAHYFFDLDLVFTFEQTRLAVLLRYQLNQADSLTKLISVPANKDALISKDEARRKLGMMDPVDDDGPTPEREEGTDEEKALEKVRFTERLTELHHWIERIEKHGRFAPFDPQYLAPEVAEKIRHQLLDKSLTLQQIFDPEFDAVYNNKRVIEAASF